MSSKIIQPHNCVHPSIARAKLKRKARKVIAVKPSVKKAMSRVRCMIQRPMDRTLPNPAPTLMYHAKTITYHPTKGFRFNG